MRTTIIAVVVVLALVVVFNRQLFEPIATNRVEEDRARVPRWETTQQWDGIRDSLAVEIHNAQAFTAGEKLTVNESLARWREHCRATGADPAATQPTR